jgi:hypothetical protein
MGVKVRRDGAYAGTPLQGLEFPEMLVGGAEIARFIRKPLKTAQRFCKERRLPVWKDSQGRWVTTRRLIEKQGLEQVDEYFKMLRGQQGATKPRDEQEAVLRIALAALREYGVHKGGRPACQAWARTAEHTEAPCTCGLEKIIQQLELAVARARNRRKEDGGRREE